jgi:hypothetical protein
MALAGGTLIALSTWAAPTVAGAEPIRTQACDPPVEATVPGGYAAWTECHSGGETRVEGWVKDTRADNDCAQVYAIFTPGNQYRSKKVCWWGSTETFNWNERASNAEVFLRVID